MARAVGILTADGVALYPRGGGYSYTDAYLPTRRPAVIVDTRGLKGIVEVNAADMYVTVEAGCTWRDLDARLEAEGLRTPFWGPLSGRYATVGGSISHGAVSLGSAKYGPSADSVLGLQIIAADGSLITTGSAGQPHHNPFFRSYGPDVTGLFCGDGGALGIKATVTLRLIKRPTHVDTMSFGFEKFESLADGMAAAARLGSITESMGMSLKALIKSTASTGLKDDLRVAAGIARSGGLIRALRIALAGRRALHGAAPHTAHFALEANSRRELKALAAEARRAIGAHGAEMINTVPTAMRAMPFATYDVIGLDGRRQLPMHTILPYSRAVDFHRRFEALMAAEADPMRALGVAYISVYAGVGGGGFLFEPVLLWNDVPEEFHRRHSRAEVLAKSTATAPNHAARTYVAELRGKIIDIMYACGGVHLQIGKVYPHSRGRDGGAAALMRVIKQQMDPKGLMNPGALERL